MMCNKTCLYVRDNALIGEFKDAIENTVWRMDLTRINAVSFKVVHTGATWDLGMEGVKGEFTPVASFESQDKAKRALKKIACALRHRGWGRRLYHAVLMILLAAAAFTVIDFATYKSGSEVSAPAVAPGQSRSADSALRPPAPVQP